MPGDAVAIGGVHASALRATIGIVLAPEIVVHDEVTRRGGVPLTTEVGTASDGGSGGQRGQGKSKQLHVVKVNKQ